MDITIYNNRLKDIIDRHQPIITINLHSNKYELHNFFINLNDFFTQISTRDIINNYFIKSFYLQLWTMIQSYSDSRNGKLIGNSVNCKFALADLVIANSPHIFKGFFKIVNLQSQFHHPHRSGEDLLICDIVSAIIIERLKNKNIKINHHFTQYIDASLGYYKKVGNNEFWMLDNNRYTNINSMHHFNYTVNHQFTDYNNKCIIMTGNAVNLLSLKHIFLSYKNNKNSVNLLNCLNALIDYVNLSNVLKYLGIYYGFIHNDLHAANIIFNLDTNKLMFIDLGRVSFRKYIDRPSIDINSITEYNFYKLGYNDLYSDISPVDTYSKLYTNPRLFIHRLSEPSPNNPNLYYGFIFDMITLTIQFYIKTIYLFYNANPILFQHISQYLMNIVNIEYFGNIDNLINDENDIYNFEMNTVNLNDLFINYNAAKTFIDTLNESHNINIIHLNDIKALFHEIANGLLITAILFHSIGIGIPSKRPIIINPTHADPIFFWALQIHNTVKLTNFYTYLYSLYQNEYYKIQLNKIDYIAVFFTRDIVMPSNLSMGGKKNVSTKVSSIRKLKKYSIKTPELFKVKNQTTVDINILTNNYEKMLNDNLIYQYKIKTLRNTNYNDIKK